MSLLIKNGTILTAASEFTGDIYIEGETIRQIGTNLSVNASQPIDAFVFSSRRRHTKYALVSWARRGV